MVEVARADFNNDGIEDILLFKYGYTTHRALVFGIILIFTRKTASSFFEIVSLSS